eukprot:5096048-Pleurochrysis_carterae.AAC.2
MHADQVLLCACSHAVPAATTIPTAYHHAAHPTAARRGALAFFLPNRLPPLLQLPLPRSCSLSPQRLSNLEACAKNRDRACWS